jgi:molybdopterin molybdotransferase
MLLNERETLNRVLQSVRPPSVESISIWEAGERVLAQDLVATVALPRFDNSTMDGYAVRAENAVSGARLLVFGEQAAGQDLELSVGRGEAVRIYTGAPLPRHADTVIMQEDVDADGRTILAGKGDQRENIGCAVAIFARAEAGIEGSL